MPDIPAGDIQRNLYELAIINRRLGGHAITLAGFSKLLSSKNKNQIHVCEIGCGGGDNLKVIENRLHGKDVKALVSRNRYQPGLYTGGRKYKMEIPEFDS